MPRRESPVPSRRGPLSLTKAKHLRSSSFHNSNVRSNTDATSSSAGDDTHANIYIILVDGFKSMNTSRYREEISQWKVQTNKQYANDSVQAKGFHFNTSKLLSDESYIYQRVDKLAQMITNLDGSQTQDRPGSSEGHGNQPPDVNPDNISSTANPASFILVGHALGALVIKHLISQRGYQSMIVNTVKAIFLDICAPANRDSITEAKEYIESLKKTFAPKLRVNNSIYERMRRIDESFQDSLKDIQGNTEKPLKCQFLKLWKNTVTPDERRFRRLISHFFHRHRAETAVSNPFEDLDTEIADFLAGRGKFSAGNHHVHSQALPTVEPHGISPAGSSRPLQPVGEFKVGSTASQSRPQSYVGREGNEAIILPPSNGEPSTVDEKKVENVIKIAETYLEKGDLKYAEDLFQQSANDLERLREKLRGNADALSAHQEQRISEVRFQRVVVGVCRGRYEQASIELMEIWKGTDNSTLKFKVGRWLGISLILQGDYLEAKNRLENLLKISRSDSTLDMDEIELTTRRDLALAYAYLGDFGESAENIRMAKRTISTINSKIKESDAMTDGSKDRIQANSQGALKTAQDNIVLTEARLNLIWGNYQQGLNNAEDALKGMVRHLGNRHLKTLESAMLRAHLLALNSKSLEAETACRDTLRSMRAELGDAHPQTLETMNVLVFIFRKQARLVESVNMSKLVCSMMTTSLTKDHPHTLQARAELAANYLSIGDYEIAAQELVGVIRICRQRYSWLHPDTLHYLSELAHVYSRNGILAAAEKLALAVLQRQTQAYAVGAIGRKKYSLTHSSEKRSIRRTRSAVEVKGVAHSNDPNSTKTRTVVQPILDAIEFEYKIYPDNLERNIPKAEDAKSCEIVQHEANGRQLHNIGPKESKLIVHPFLLSTLQVVTAIELQKPHPDVDLAQEILKLILKWRTKTLGQGNTFTLTSEFELAVAYREDQYLKNATELFWHVFMERQKTLGKTHPDTLSAKLEVVITNCASDIWVDIDNRTEDRNTGNVKGELPTENRKSLADNWSKVEVCSKDILILQEARLGQRHPETLKTLLWIFFVQLAYHGKKEQANRTAQLALERLRHESVKTQRLFESLQMQEKIELFYKEYDHLQAAEEVREYISKEIANYGTKKFIKQAEETTRGLLDGLNIGDDNIKAWRPSPISD